MGWGLMGGCHRLQWGPSGVMFTKLATSSAYTSAGIM